MLGSGGVEGLLVEVTDCASFSTRCFLRRISRLRLRVQRCSHAPRAGWWKRPGARREVGEDPLADVLGEMDAGTEAAAGRAVDQSQVPADDRPEGTLFMLVDITLQEFGIGRHRVCLGYDRCGRFRTDFGATHARWHLSDTAELQTAAPSAPKPPRPAVDRRQQPGEVSSAG
jgi:hypothetical protein